MKITKENYKKFISEDDVCLYVLKLEKDKVLYAESFNLALKLLASIFEEQKEEKSERTKSIEKKTYSIEKKIKIKNNDNQKTNMINTGFCIFDNSLNVIYLKVND